MIKPNLTKRQNLSAKFVRGVNLLDCKASSSAKKAKIFKKQICKAEKVKFKHKIVKFYK